MVARRNQVTGCPVYPTSVSSFWAGVDGASTLRAKPLRSAFVVIFSVACAVVRLPPPERRQAPRRLLASATSFECVRSADPLACQRPALPYAALSPTLRRLAWRSILPSPETLLRWHRELVRRQWAAYRRQPRRQGSVPRSELHELILQGKRRTRSSLVL
jgi:hypothetical protein